MWRGDLGLTDLIDRQNVPKSDLRFEVLGTLDEASSALGLVRAGSASPAAKELVLAVQRDLCWMMSEFAAESDQARPPSQITQARLDWLEAQYQSIVARNPLGNGFVVPGDSMAGAALQLARTIVRRAERYVTMFQNHSPLPNPLLIAYLNRLSAVLYALARAEDVAAGVTAPTMAKPSPDGQP